MTTSINLGSHYDKATIEPKPKVLSVRRDHSSDEQSVHRVILVDGGAAGLELVTRLGRRLGLRGRAQITLVDSARAHIWKPLLHEVVAGSLDPDE